MLLKTKEMNLYCPDCWGAIALEVTAEVGSDGVQCEDCGCDLQVEWGQWGDEIWVDTGEIGNAECPFCHNETKFFDLPIEYSAQEGDETADCEACGATLRFRWDYGGNIFYNSEGDKRDDSGVQVELLQAPQAQFPCPGCGRQLTIEDLDEESWTTTFDCVGCSRTLEVTWSDWGRDVEEPVVKSEARRAGVTPTQDRHVSQSQS